MNKNQQKLLVLILVIFLVAVGLWSAEFWSNSDQEETIACTLEAKLCPDGSSVGRVPPSCNFAPCATSAAAPAGWNLATNKQGISFYYPSILSTKYIRAFTWPPLVQISEESFKCLSAGPSTELAGETDSRTINERKYCITKISDGAAGSVYEQYVYTTPWTEDNTLTLTFTLRSTQCGVYDEPQRIACEVERREFDIGPLIDKIVGTIQI